MIAKLSNMRGYQPCPRCHLTMFTGKCEVCLPTVEEIGFSHVDPNPADVFGIPTPKRISEEPTIGAREND
jgi:hypothetical protein